jgi:hypothetical protein
MYKLLIFVVASFLIGGAGYYYNSTGVPSLIAQNIENGEKANYGVSAAQVFSGTYECNESRGCTPTTRMILEEDTTLDIVSIVDGEQSSLGQGTWGIGTNGALVLVLRTPATASSSGYPTSLIANKMSGIKITGFSNKKPLFPGMKNPTFVRIQN